MAVNEINDINTQNYKTDPIMPDNLKRSDELDIGENNVLKGESYYARNKRISKSSKIVLLTLSITAMLTGGGAFISNSILGKEPIINNFDNFYHIENNEFYYSIDVTIDKSKLVMEIMRDDIIYILNMDTSDIYSGSVSLDSGKYTITFVNTNYFDYKKVMEKYTTTFTI